MPQVFAEKVIYRAEGIFVGGSIEIEGAAQEMPDRIGNEKLVGGGGIASEGKINAI